MNRGHSKKARSIEHVPGKKEPKFSQQVPGIKEPRSINFVSYGNLKAAWRINKIQLVDPYGWHKLTFKEISDIREKLSDFETMTWNEIFVVAKKRNHPIRVDQLRCEHARRWMKVHMSDQPLLWTLRLTGPERVWGIFSEGAYQIIFWDPNHLIYPTNI